MTWKSRKGRFGKPETLNATQTAALPLDGFQPMLCLHSANVTLSHAVPSPVESNLDQVTIMRVGAGLIST